MFNCRFALLTVLFTRLSPLTRQASTKNRILNCLKVKPLSSQQSLYDSHAILKHICSICGRTWSSSYQKHHSLTPEEIPYSSICSRCVRSLQSILPKHLSQVAAVPEIHHYHHICCYETTSFTNKSPVELCGMEISPSQSISSEKLETSSPIPRVYHPYRLPAPVKEPSPPCINHWSKPTLSVK